MKANFLKLKIVLLTCCLTSACNLTPLEQGSIVTAGAAIAANIPEGEVYQVYYLGVFDPIEQVPPTFYRITVRGQASIASDMKFASGWVPAEAIDTLTSRTTMDRQGQISLNNEGQQVISPRRKFVLMGPEGVREGPDKHRLVIVMGASPHNFFSAVDSTLGELLDINREASEAPFKEDMFEELKDLAQERQLLKAFCQTFSSHCQGGAS